MKNHFLTVALALIAITLTGAAVAGSVDYGAPYEQKVAKASLQTFLDSYLKRPDSAHVTCQSDLQKVTKQVGNKSVSGYLQTCLIDAADIDGVYVGATRFEFLYRDNQVVTCWVQKRRSYPQLTNNT